MQLFRHLGLMIAVFWCAAMVVAPMAAAAGAGQDMNHGPQGMGPGQAGSGQGSGNSNALFQQRDQAGNAGPGQGGRPQGMDRGNMTGFMNRTNMTPQERPDRDPDNTTAINMTGWHGHRGNMTGMNMTGFMNRTNMTPPVKPDWDPDNTTAINMTGWHGHRGNMTGMNMTSMTPPDQPPQQGSGNGQGWQGSSQPQAGNRNDSESSLIIELVSWLKAHGIS